VAHGAKYGQNADKAPNLFTVRRFSVRQRPSLKKLGMQRFLRGAEAGNRREIYTMGKYKVRKMVDNRI
jgi:hypothetical protein